MAFVTNLKHSGKEVAVNTDHVMAISPIRGGKGTLVIFADSGNDGLMWELDEPYEDAQRRFADRGDWIADSITQALHDICDLKADLARNEE